MSRAFVTRAHVMPSSSCRGRHALRQETRCCHPERVNDTTLFISQRQRRISRPEFLGRPRSLGPGHLAMVTCVRSRDASFVARDGEGRLADPLPGTGNARCFAVVSPQRESVGASAQHDDAEHVLIGDACRPSASGLGVTARARCAVKVVLSVTARPRCAGTVVPGMTSPAKCGRTGTPAAVAKAG